MKIQDRRLAWLGAAFGCVCLLADMGWADDFKVDMTALKEGAAKVGEVKGVAAPSIYQVDLVIPPLAAEPRHDSVNPGPQSDDPDIPPVDRAGYAVAQFDKNVSYSWDGRDVGDKAGIYLDKAVIKYSVVRRIEISSIYLKGTCPYKETLKHELSHADAFKAIVEKSQASLAEALADPMRFIKDPARLPGCWDNRNFPTLYVGTSSKPMLLEKKYAVIEAYRSKVEARANCVIEQHIKWVKGQMEKDRSAKDTPESYRTTVYEKCPAADWKAADARARR